VIERALALLCSNYVFADKATEAAQAVRARHEAGDYRDLTDEALAERLSAVLYEVCADKHLKVRLRHPELRAELTEAERRAVEEEWTLLTNNGIAKVERLDGNIGYLEIRYITDTAIGGTAIAAAMELVSHTGALIIDLRRNGGGEPNGVASWCSYLFPDDKTHLNDIHDGTTGLTRQYWTLAHLPGPRYLDRPVYVLIGAKTLSAGEEFCYNLKAQGRATLIGQTTWGGAHPTKAFPLTPTLEITIPYARSVNPVTGTNWEGTGVEPDLRVPVEEAFAVAYRQALQDCLAASTSSIVLAEIREALASANATPPSA
jgi:C-terminal processing protease CtpA/Prc